MTIKYLDSKRIEGVAGDLTSINLTSGTGGWKEVGRTTLGSAGDDIEVTGLPDKPYYMFLIKMLTGGTRTSCKMTFNGEVSGTNYYSRYSDNGGTDGTYQGNGFTVRNNSYGYDDSIAIGYIASKSGQQKAMISNYGGEAYYGGSNVAPRMMETIGKWSNTSDAITSIKVSNGESGDYQSGSELVILGYDPADTHTTNFWEELANVNGSGSNTLSSGTITAKKYLWLQFYLDPSASYTPKVNFNGDGGSNYNNRYNMNGGGTASDGTESGYYSGFGGQVPQFSNMFIINGTADTKVALNSMVYQGTAGAGTQPERVNSAGVWYNTSAQITSVDITGGSATLSTSSLLKVWGHD
jgi:hypothetical protein